MVLHHVIGASLGDVIGSWVLYHIIGGIVKLQGWVLMGYLYIGSPNSRVVGGCF